MKQNIIMVIILIALFFFGLLIYDFSDQLSSDVTKHDWYLYQNNDLTVMSFKKNKFVYYKVSSGKSIKGYESCSTYTYNKSINVVKLNCSATGNKIYIASYDDDTLKLTIEGKAQTFYATQKLAEIAKFKEDNKLTDKEYNELLNVDLTKYTFNSVDELITLYKSKNTKYVAFINSNVTYKNALNYKAFDNILASSDKTIVAITTGDLSEYEAERLHGIYDDFSSSPTDYIKNAIYIYLIGNKKVNLVETIDIQSINDVSKYTDIN